MIGSLEYFIFFVNIIEVMFVIQRIVSYLFQLNQLLELYTFIFNPTTGIIIVMTNILQ